MTRMGNADVACSWCTACPYVQGSLATSGVGWCGRRLPGLAPILPSPGHHTIRTMRRSARVKRRWHVGSLACPPGLGTPPWPGGPWQVQQGWCPHRRHMSWPGCCTGCLIPPTEPRTRPPDRPATAALASISPASRAASLAPVTRRWPVGSVRAPRARAWMAGGIGAGAHQAPGAGAGPDGLRVSVTGLVLDRSATSAGETDKRSLARALRRLA